MKIEIYESGERKIRLIFPTAVIFNRLTAKVAAKMIQKTLAGRSDELAEEITDLEKIAESLPEQVPHIDADALAKLCTEIRRFKRTHPGFVLVDVQDEDGDGVVITL